MVYNSNETKRIAFVVAALTGEELQASQRDANTIFDILTDPSLGMCHPKQSKLIHECSSREELESAIFSVLEYWNSSTQLILYFSGHGEVIRNNYCLKFGEKFYPFRNLLTELETNGVSRAILILDACHSGAAIGTKSDSSSIIVEEDDIPQGIAIIASSKKTQHSYELKDGSHSVFTSLLCRGIKTGLDGTPTDNGLISVTDIVTYIQNKLSKEDEFSSYLQTPVFQISKADKAIWITKNITKATTKQEVENYRDIFQNTYFVKSSDDLRILYEQNAPSYHPCLNATIDDLDLSLLQEYSNKVEPGFFDNQRLQEVLSKLVLYSPILHDEKKFLHKSAVLCFHRTPHMVYPQARSVFVVGNPGAPHFEREDVYGPLSYQVKQLVQKVENNIVKKSYIEKNGARHDVAEINISVVREMISNAITHRNYDANSIVKVAVTKEAVEVYNPGSFPYGNSWYKLLKSSLSVSEPTDAAIALYLTNLLVYEGVGRGFSVFKRYIEENGEDSLTCKEESGIVCVRLLRHTVSQKFIKNDSIVINLKEYRQTSSPRNIPRIPAINFVGREKELAAIHKVLQKSNRFILHAITGMGGIGKTEIAIQYAAQYSDDYPGGICWLNGRQSNLLVQLRRFCQAYMKLEVPQNLSLNEQANWCWINWQPSSGLVLIIIDDVTDYLSIFEILPTEQRFRILITTRSRNIDSMISETLITQLSPEDAMVVLSQHLGKVRVQSEAEAARKLCEWLGYLPLGLTLLGKYIASDPDLSLAEVLEGLEARRLDNESLNHPEETFTTAQPGLKEAFELSWQELDKTTQDVAELLSLFAPYVIPWKLVESTCQRLNWSKADVKNAKKQLYKCNLIERLKEKERSYKIHPLIKEFLQVKLAQSILIDDLKQAFATEMVAVAKEISETITRKNIELAQDAIPHLAEAAQNLTAAMRDEDLMWAFVGLARFYQGQGFYALAEPWYEQCLSTTRQRLGEEHLDVASSLNNLALLYQEQGRYDQAEPLYLQALEIYKRLLGEEHTDVATGLNNLGLLYYSQGHYDQAESLYQQALKMRKRLLGEEHPDVATTLNSLALLYYSQGQYDQAESLYQQALEMRKRLLGEEHPDVATTLNSLAGLYRSQGDYAKAKPLYQKALVIYKRLLGEEHPNVATTLNNLAGLYRSQGDYAKAKPLYQKALVIYKRLLGEEHPSVATTLNNLARLYQEQGYYDQAESLYQQALKMTKRLLGEEHPDVANSLNNLALLYYSQGQYAEAKPLYQQALKMRKRLLGEEHPDVATTLNSLAGLYQEQGHYDQAESLYQQALEMRKRLLREEHPDVATTLNNLAGLYQEQGHYDQAESLYQQALKIAQQVLGQEHPNTVTIYENLKLVQMTVKNSSKEI
ncbi:MAG: tetratricopeptide repeat protein [Symploca sp. SIO2G7]|nr:tetratricopeptide repeat protein [Symploca sp. SIO2G7]